MKYKITTFSEFKEWLAIIQNIQLTTLEIKGMQPIKMDVLLLWVQLGSLK